MNTVVNVMGPKDRLAMVLFTTNSRIDFDFTEMNEDGKKMAHEKINALKKEGSTNAFSGIKLPIEMIQNRTDKSRNPSVLFFTDGQENCGTPREGTVKGLQAIKDSQDIHFPVHTMGFGQYNTINSEMTFEISKAFNGMNGYIPDPTCIGTVFVNTIANILTT